MLKERFQILGQLGKGTYGSVLKGIRKADSTLYAIKKVNLAALNPRDRQNSVNEIRLLASISCPFVISYRQAFYDESDRCLYLVMEFAQKGDLLKLIDIKRKNKTLFSETQIWNAAGQLLAGLGYLHSLKIIHRDLKSANIFLSEGTYKIGDLNVSKVMKDQLAHTQTGTPYYASPEIWRDQPYNFKSDLWSLGCILYQMCALRPPFMSSSMEELSKKIKKGVTQRIPTRYSSELSDFISSMMRVKAQHRPEIEQLLSNGNIPKFVTNRLQTGLLGTIKVPLKLTKLKDKLPLQNYSKFTKGHKQISLPPLSNFVPKERSPSERILLHKVKNKSLVTELSALDDKKSRISRLSNNSNQPTRSHLSKDQRLFVLQPTLLKDSKLQLRDFQHRRKQLLRLKILQANRYAERQGQQQRGRSKSRGGYEALAPSWWG